MKIVLPKSLAEPVSIPWEMISSHEGAKSVLIQQRLSLHMQYRRRHNRIPSENVLGNRRNILESLRIVVRSMGGCFPISKYERSGNGDLYTVAYQVNRKCYSYSILLPDKTGSDLKARYAR